VAVLELTAFGGVLDAERLGEVGAHVVRCARLQSAAVPHHALDGEGPPGAGEPLARRLLARHHRHGGYLPGHVDVQVEREHGLAHRVGLVGVRGVPFLPEEFGGAQ
jgi:hypothetical protein